MANKSTYKIPTFFSASRTLYHTIPYHHLGILLLPSAHTHLLNSVQENLSDSICLILRMRSYYNGGPTDCACLARAEPRPDFDMELAERLILTEARRIFPGDPRRFEIRAPLVMSIRDEEGPLTLHARVLVEILPKRAPDVVTEGPEAEDEEQIWRPNDATVLMAGQFASSAILATEGLLNMARVTPEFGGAEPVRAGDLKEFKDDLCAACGKQRWKARSSGPVTGRDTK